MAIIPAHNEEDGIEKTIRSLLRQVPAPSVVLVMADNCTDETIPRARAAGAEVIETVGNTAKKAGALNQGLARVLPLLSDDDFVLAMDADGELTGDFIPVALQIFRDVPDLGGLAGSVTARSADNVLELLQAIEYARGTRLASRKGGQVHVLSGAATMFPAGVLRHIERARGNELPGRRLPPQHRWCARRADRLGFLPRRHRAPHGADPAGRGNLLPEAPGLHRPPPVLPGGRWRCTAGPSSAGATVPWGQSWCCCS